MAKSAKPTFIPDWARNNTTDPVLGTANVVEPSEAKKDGGWDAYEKPPRNWMNWLFRGAHLWIDYFNQFFTATHQFKIDEILEETSAAGVTIDGLTIKDGVIAEDLKVQPNDVSSRFRLQTIGTGITDADGFMLALSDTSSTMLIWLYEQRMLQIATNNVDRMRFAAGSPQIQIANAARDLVNSSGYVVADKQRETGSGAGVLNTKIIEIGDWNMDYSESFNVAHGLTLANIRSIQVTIRNDSNNTYYNLCGSSESKIYGGVYFNSTNITCLRDTDGAFDSTDFNSTSYNRGWITIQYID